MIPNPYDMKETEDLKKGKALLTEKYERISRRRMALGTIKDVIDILFTIGFILFTILAILVMIEFITEPEPVSGEATPAIEEAVTVAVPVAVPADAWEPSEDVPLEPELQAYIYDACETYDVPMPLALALIEHESGFDPWVYSADGRNFGLMQINSINYGWLRGAGIEPTGYPGNIEAGVLMLGTLLDKYADPHKALVAYNGGEAGAKRLWDRGIYTSSFSRSVLAAAEQYERE